MIPTDRILIDELLEPAYCFQDPREVAYRNPESDFAQRQNEIKLCENYEMKDDAVYGKLILPSGIAVESIYTVGRFKEIDETGDDSELINYTIGNSKGEIRCVTDKRDADEEEITQLQSLNQNQHVGVQLRPLILDGDPAGYYSVHPTPILKNAEMKFILDAARSLFQRITILTEIMNKNDIRGSVENHLETHLSTYTNQNSELIAIKAISKQTITELIEAIEYRLSAIKRHLARNPVKY